LNITTAKLIDVPPATCPLCGVVANQVLAPELRRGKGKVFYCSTCDHGFLAENLIQDTKAYYDGEYRQEYSHNADAATTNAREIFEIYSQFQADRMRIIEPELNTDSTVLEVGASAGQFVSHIKSRVAKVHAIELDSACCKFLNEIIGVECDANFLENSRFVNERYDIICAFQVMEHVEDPVAFLNTLKRVARPGATIFIEVPNLRDPLLSVWDVPTYRKFFYHSAHLHYFTEKSVRQVAGKAGFTDVNMEVIFTQDYNLLNHLHWMMNDGPQANCLVGLSEVRLKGPDDEMSNWLSEEMMALNQRYIDRLVEKKHTSNMLLRLKND
jgi:2-polyprenyl-3-methyl-5-hydroxy-6-metoxy-1,4-benzoquinol methylase